MPPTVDVSTARDTATVRRRQRAHLIVQAGHLGYYIHISVFTYSQVSQQTSGRIYLHYVVREDAQIFYGFGGREEREIFRMLISVSGVGANTARLIHSSLSPDEITHAILSGNVSVFARD